VDAPILGPAKTERMPTMMNLYNPMIEIIVNDLYRPINTEVIGVW
jgi:hypothetical protein